MYLSKAKAKTLQILDYKINDHHKYNYWSKLGPKKTAIINEDFLQRHQNVQNKSIKHVYATAAYYVK